MTTFTGIVRLDQDRVVLACPDVGMPWIVQMFAPGGHGVDGWEHLIARGPRINGMDDSGPAACYLPTGGLGHFRWPAIAGHRDGRDFILAPTGWTITVNADESAATLAATDPIAQLAIAIELSLDTASVLHSSVTLTNQGASAYSLERCMAGTVLIGPHLETVTSFGANWGREFHEHVDPAPKRSWIMESRRGRTSHDRFPGLLLKSGSASMGIEYHGIHFGFSGNHVMVVDPTDDGRYLVHAGELFEPGEMILAPGASYQSPVLYACRDGLGSRENIAEMFWNTVRRHVLNWQSGEMQPRPVLLNTWEGNYFKHDVENLKAQASAAAELGIERFVLDDGWFGRRDDDTTSLGDWVIDRRKYPNGLSPLIDHVVGLGMQFGLWFEPEMINTESDLYRAHPEWVLQVAGRPLLPSRHQLVLDLTRAEVSDFLFQRVSDVLGSHAISYVKWDMNRDLTHAGNAQGRAATARQTRALYALIDRVRAAHPSVEIESCASGGGRADYGALSRTHRIWTSDCTDALERLTIQRGARLFLPPEVLGTHVSPSPNHQTQRHHSLAFRAIVAFFGHLGVELNPLTLTAEERAELTAWIGLHKALRPILHHANAMPVDLPIVDGRYAFGVRLTEDGGERLILAVAQAEFQVNEQPVPLRVPVFNSDKSFTVQRLGPAPADFVRSVASQHRLLSGEIAVAGGLLERHGLPIPQLFPQSALLLDIRSVGDQHA